MTASVMAEFIGRTGTFVVDKMTFPIVVNDCRERFGNLDLLIVPFGGFGSKWVLETSVRLDPVV